MTDSDFPQFPPDIEQEILSQVDAKIVKYQALDEEELLRITKNADAVICSAAPMTHKVISNMEKVGVIVVAGVGYDNIDVKAATDFGILVCNCPDFITYELPDHTVALILTLARKIVNMNAHCKANKWNTESWLEFKPLYNLAERTVGIVGFGRFGRLVAERLKVFKLNILAYDPYVPKEVAEKFGVKLIDLFTLLKNSDIISIHTPLSAETCHMIGKKELDMMKESAIIVNTARGEIIDQRALTEALKSRRIAGAALDVLEKEPPDPDDPISNLDNVVITPHMAWYSESSYMNLRRMTAEEVARILSGKTPKHPLNLKF